MAGSGPSDDGGPGETQQVAALHRGRHSGQKPHLTGGRSGPNSSFHPRSLKAPGKPSPHQGARYSHWRRHAQGAQGALEE